VAIKPNKGARIKMVAGSDSPGSMWDKREAESLKLNMLGRRKGS